jgi:DNA helicase-2/ATP-dependent DNA helicase PcrA
VALTRAQNDVVLMAPLKFHLTNQSRQGDAHVYGGRSRFMTERVLQKLDAVTFHGTSNASGDNLRIDAENPTLDVSARMKEMW